MDAPTSCSDSVGSSISLPNLVVAEDSITEEPNNLKQVCPCDDTDCAAVDPLVEIVYEELEMVAIGRNPAVPVRIVPCESRSLERDAEVLILSDVIDEEPEYSSLSTNSEESGVTSPFFRYEEELDSLSLCSSTSVVDDREDDTIVPSEPVTPVVAKPDQNISPSEQHSPLQVKQRRGSEGAVVVPREILSKFVPVQDPPQEKSFRRQNLRNSILKRFTVSWKREYDFQLETDRCYAEEESSSTEDCQLTGPLAPPPVLPAARPDLKHDEIIRRHVLGSIIDSENSYVESMIRLVKEYQEPLKTSVPPIVSPAKITLIFSKIPQILQIHLTLRAALAKLMNDWKTEKLSDLGDVFVGLFSKPYVAEVYASYVCNFATAIDTVKRLSKERPAFAEFLRVRQESSKDRLPIFGLLVKPVQRFPQFILLLQDLLKNTPAESLDRISLQLALTHLETLADGLNERKRENEQEKAAKDVLKWAKVPSSVRSSTAGVVEETARRLIAEDDFKELELSSAGRVSRIKTRRLLLLSDLLICTVPRTELADRLSPQWIVNIADVQVIDEKPVKFLGFQISPATSNGTDSPKEDPVNDHVTKLYQEMSDLRQDYEAVKRMYDVMEGLKFDYSELKSMRMRTLLNDIQATIQVKMEEVARSDDCTFQILVPSGKSKTQKTRIILQAAKRKDKLLWITLLHLSRLAYDKRKNPSWDDPDMKGIGTPLFFLSRILHLQSGPRKFSYKSGCYCFASPKEDSLDKQRLKTPSKPDGLVFLCSTDGLSSRISILSVDGLRTSTLSHQQQTAPIELLSFALTQTEIACCEWIPGVYEVDLSAITKGSLAHDSVWFGTESGSVMVFLASSRIFSLGSYTCDAPVRSIRFNFDKVYVALANCNLKVFKRNEGGCWELKPVNTIQCASTGMLNCITELPNKILCAIDSQVVAVSCVSDTVVGHHQPRKTSGCCIDKMVRCGTGLWISYKNSSVVSLFHIDTFKHLQDINIAPNINRILAERDSERSAREISVTSLLAVRGSLWIGTNVGLVIHISLPKLDGVPINLSRPAVSFHSHLGPSGLLLALQPRTITRKPPQARPSPHDLDYLDTALQKSFRLSTGNQLALRNWSDDSPDIYGLFDSLMRGGTSSSTSEEEIGGSTEQLRFSARRRHSLPLLPVDAEFHPHRPVSFLRSSEHNSLVLRKSSLYGHNSRPMSFSPGPDWPGINCKSSSRDVDILDNNAKDEPLSRKPRFVKAERDKSKSAFGTQWHSTLIVISAGSGYRLWRGSPEHDKDDSSLCVIGWEMKV